MAEDKKYLWLKLKKDFFQSKEIKIIKTVPEGHKYTVIWLELLLHSLEMDDIGILKFNETIPYSPEMLAKIIDEDTSILICALKLFETYNMIKIMENGEIWVDCIHKMIGKSDISNERVQKFREKQKLQQLEYKNNININTDIDIEREIEGNVTRNVTCNKKKRVTEEKTAYGEYVKLSITEYQKLITEYGQDAVDLKIKRMNNYIPSTGKKYKDFYRTLLNWFLNDKEKEKPKSEPKACPICHINSPVNDKGECKNCLKIKAREEERKLERHEG